MLDFVGRDLAGAWRAEAVENSTSAGPSELEIQEEQWEQLFLARKTVGSLLDMTALATFHVSPLTVLAVYSEVAYGSRTIIQLLGVRLKEQGIIPAKTIVDDTTSLLAALEKAAGIAAKMFDQPPLSIQGLRKTIDETKSTVSQVQRERLLSYSEIDQLWRQMELAARDQNASIWDVSATISILALNNIQAIDEGGLVSLEISGNVYQEQIIDHYWEGLRAIERHGLLPTLSRSSRPYVEAVWTNYALDRKTWTEQLISGDLIKWGWSQLSWPRLTRS
jgi:phage pi2 protein 07